MVHTLDPEEVLSRLFGSVSRGRIVQLLISHAGRAFYQREIMYETGLSLQLTQRELKNLFDLGIIRKRETVDRVYYEADSSSPLFNALVELWKSAQRHTGSQGKGWQVFQFLRSFRSRPD